MNKLSKPEIETLKANMPPDFLDWCVQQFSNPHILQNMLLKTLEERDQLLVENQQLKQELANVKQR